MSITGATGKLIQYVDVPQASFITVNLPRPAIGVLVVNEANVAVSVLDDAGKQTNPPTPAGLTVGYNYLQGLLSPQVGCVGSYQGNARVYFYDGWLDLSKNPALQQPPGSITLSGPVTVTFQSAQPIVFQGTQPIDITAFSGGNVPVNIAASGGSVVVKTNDVLVESNTGLLVGLLASHVIPFTQTSGTQHDEPISNPCDGFGLQVNVNTAGRMNVWVTNAGNDVYLIRDQMFYPSPVGNKPVNKRFAEAIAAGDTIHVRWDDAAASLAGILRY